MTAYRGGGIGWRNSVRIAGRARSPARPNVVRVGVIGYGYWGPNIVRNLQGLERCQVAAVCDQQPELRSAGSPAAYPALR